MNGWDFAKHFVDLAYEHWIITMAFLCIIRKVSIVSISREVENERRNRDGN